MMTPLLVWDPESFHLCPILPSEDSANSLIFLVRRLKPVTSNTNKGSGSSVDKVGWTCLDSTPASWPSLENNSHTGAWIGKTNLVKASGLTLHWCHFLLRPQSTLAIVTIMIMIVFFCRKTWIEMSLGPIHSVECIPVTPTLLATLSTLKTWNYDLCLLSDGLLIIIIIILLIQWSNFHWLTLSSALSTTRVSKERMSGPTRKIQSRWLAYILLLVWMSIVDWFVASVDSTMNPVVRVGMIIGRTRRFFSKRSEVMLKSRIRLVYCSLEY